MVEAAEDGHLDDVTFFRRLDLPVDWAIASKAQVSPGGVIVGIEVRFAPYPWIRQ